MVHHVDGAASIEPEAGIFTWVLAEDIVYGDTSVASHFGLDSNETVTGLPIGAYLESIHVEDRPLTFRRGKNSAQPILFPSYHMTSRQSLISAIKPYHQQSDRRR